MEHAGRDTAVCNVSEDGGMERDIDMEIAEYQRRKNSRVATPVTHGHSYRREVPKFEPKRTMSQRMLSRAREANKSQPVQRNFDLQRTHSFRTKVMEKRPTRDPEVDSRSSSSSGSGSSMSCAQRLEARIHKKQEKGHSHTSPGHSSNRHTYPSKSLQKLEARLSQLSVDTDHQETRQSARVVRERLASVLDTPAKEPTHQSSSNPGVFFKFEGPPSGSGSNNRPRRITTADSTVQENRQRTNSTLHLANLSPEGVEHKYQKLANQLGEIETVVEGMEACLGAAALRSLTHEILYELEGLEKSTERIRSQGASLLMASMNAVRGQTELEQRVRRLVSRSSAAQARMKLVESAIRRMVV